MCYACHIHNVRVHVCPPKVLNHRKKHYRYYSVHNNGQTNNNCIDVTFVYLTKFWIFFFFSKFPQNEDSLEFSVEVSWVISGPPKQLKGVHLSPADHLPPVRDVL